MAQQLREFLVRTPFFGGLLDASLDRVIAMLVERRFPQGSVVYNQGEPGRSMYVVGAGDLVMVQSADSGHEVRLMHLGPGDFFGETTLIEMQPRQFTVRVEAEACLYELTNMDLYRLYQEDVEAYVMVLQNINRELCRRLRRRDDRITEIADAFGDPETQLRPGRR